VPTADSPNTMNVTSSDKLDDKLTKLPPDLALVIEAWPKLPNEIISVIMTIIRASIAQ